MRILSSYSLKHGDESYFCTFEVLSEIPKEEADSVVDELFLKARSAIQRQLNQPANKDSLGAESKRNGNGAHLTAKQRSLIIRLAKDRGEYVNNLNDLTIQQASEIISRLMSVEA